MSKASGKPAFGRLSKDLFSKEIQSDLKGSEYVFVTQFKNVSSNGLSDLRKGLRKNQGKYLVVKNTLGRRVLEALPYKGLSKFVDGQCGIAVTKGDVSKVSKLFVTFAEENAGFKIAAAYVAGQVYAADGVKALASLPSREELLSKMLGSMQTPISSMVNVLSGVLRNFVNVIDQIKKTKEK